MPRCLTCLRGSSGRRCSSRQAEARPACVSSSSPCPLHESLLAPFHGLTREMRPDARRAGLAGAPWRDSNWPRSTAGWRPITAAGRHGDPRALQPFAPARRAGGGAESDDPAYYDDLRQFRPGRSARIIRLEAGQAAAGCANTGESPGSRGMPANGRAPIRRSPKATESATENRPPMAHS